MEAIGLILGLAVILIAVSLPKREQPAAVPVLVRTKNERTQ